MFVKLFTQGRFVEWGEAQGPWNGILAGICHESVHRRTLERSLGSGSS